MLGIIIGVGAVIALVSIGQGAQAMVQNQINGMGTNMMFIMPGNVMTGGASLGAGAAREQASSQRSASKDSLTTSATTTASTTQRTMHLGAHPQHQPRTDQGAEEPERKSPPGAAEWNEARAGEAHQGRRRAEHRLTLVGRQCKVRWQPRCE